MTLVWETPNPTSKSKSLSPLWHTGLANSSAKKRRQAAQKAESNEKLLWREKFHHRTDERPSQLSDQITAND